MYAYARATAVAAGLLLAAPALAQTATLTVIPRMTGTSVSNPVGRVDLDPTSAPTTPTLACSTGTPSCAVTAALGASVVLVPTSVNDAAFVSWSGCTSVSGTRCTVAMTTARSVTANFRPATFALVGRTSPALTATYTPPYIGWLRAPTTPAIHCQSGNALYAACTGRAPNGASVTLTAEPAPGARVTGWTGCTATPADATTCTMTLTQDRSVTVSFGAANVTVTGAVQGSGTISATVGGNVVDAMLCPTDCAAQVTPGGSITLTASPSAGARFAGWTGCSSSTNVCTLSAVTAPVTVTATFQANTCAGCHALPPADPHVQVAACEQCHEGYTQTTVNAPTHMDGHVDVSCYGCHGYPPAAPHAQRQDCASCHYGYENGYSETKHRNGVVDPQHTEVYGDVCPGPDSTPRCTDCHVCVTAR